MLDYLYQVVDAVFLLRMFLHLKGLPSAKMGCLPSAKMGCCTMKIFTLSCSSCVYADLVSLIFAHGFREHFCKFVYTRDVKPVARECGPLDV